jgi:uncharacterized protein (DUF1800 family)
MKVDAMKYKIHLLLALSLLCGSTLSCLAARPLPGQSGTVAAARDDERPTRVPRQSASIDLRSKNNEQDLLHLLNRLSFGAKPGDIEAVKAQGLEAYLARQLNPQTIPLPEAVKAVANLEALKESPRSLFDSYGKPDRPRGAGEVSDEEKERRQKQMHENFKKIYNESATARLTRASLSPRQLEEVMTDFWFNHFNVYTQKGLDHIWIGSYEERAIRPHVLGRFRDLLGATAHHPAMLFYLDNWQNTRAGFGENLPNFKGKDNNRFKGINENYARELMELHTLGVDGGYTQQDVQELARILTGLGFPPNAGGGGGLRRNRQQESRQFNGAPVNDRNFNAANPNEGNFNPGIFKNGNFANNQRQVPRLRIQTYGDTRALTAQGQKEAQAGYFFDSNRHDFNDKTILGVKIAGRGEEEIEQVLDLLAKHPSTAKHISYKLAQYFVADNPPASLVDKMSRQFLATDGNITKVMETMITSPEFWDKQYRNAKFKSPYRYLVSSLRATNTKMNNPQSAIGFLRQSGMPLYGCLTPDGYKNTEEAWLNPDALLNRINFATALGAGRYPGLSPGQKDPELVADTFAIDLSDKTVEAVNKSPRQLRVGLLLGSPEFMKY